LEEAQDLVVLVADDDVQVRAAIRRLLERAQVAVESYASGVELLGQGQFDRAGCLILDVHMPGISGIDVQAALKLRGIDIPIIFLTGAAQVPIAVEAMREGAIDFIEKPFKHELLVSRVRQAIDSSQRKRSDDRQRAEFASRLARLTDREREIVPHLIAGKRAKEIAQLLGSSFRTVEVHRARILEKMGADTLADLVRMCLDDTSWKSS
jgi:two-component system, LuxR family, response regulator FixJ